MGKEDTRLQLRDAAFGCGPFTGCSKLEEDGNRRWTQWFLMSDASDQRRKFLENPVKLQTLSVRDCSRLPKVLGEHRPVRHASFHSKPTRNLELEHPSWLASFATESFGGFFF